MSHPHPHGDLCSILLTKSSPTGCKTPMAGPAPPAHPLRFQARDVPWRRGILSIFLPPILIFSPVIAAFKPQRLDMQSPPR